METAVSSLGSGFLWARMGGISEIWGSVGLVTERGEGPDRRVSRGPGAEAMGPALVGGRGPGLGPSLTFWCHVGREGLPRRLVRV